MHIAAAEHIPSERVLDLRFIDGVLVLALDPKASFEALREEIRETFSATPDRFRGNDARLDLDDRSIDLFDLRRLVHVLKDEFGVTVTGLYCTPENLQRYAERELKLRVFPRRAEALEEPEAEYTEEPEVEVQAPVGDAVVSEEHSEEVGLDGQGGRRVLNISRGLRSGQNVRFNGDVHVFGDVNPGAEIIATGNVLVMGALKGMVHAGSQGDDSAVVLAFDMQPTQVRVSTHIAFPAPDRRANTRFFKQGYSPRIAWIDRGDIVIEPYQGRLPR